MAISFPTEAKTFTKSLPVVIIGLKNAFVAFIDTYFVTYIALFAAVYIANHLALSAANCFEASTAVCFAVSIATFFVISAPTTPNPVTIPPVLIEVKALPIIAFPPESVSLSSIVFPLSLKPVNKDSSIYLPSKLAPCFPPVPPLPAFPFFP